MAATVTAARWRPHDSALALVVTLGLALVVVFAQWIDARRPALALGPDADALYLDAEAARRLTLGFNGLAADWYWLRSLQYIGRKIEEQANTNRLDLKAAAELDRITAVDPRVLAQLLDMTTTLDPRFTAVYEFAAVVLPAVDAGAAVRLLEKGIAANPAQWFLHQQLAYIYWQRDDYAAAAAAFRRGARLSGVTWMEAMARQMEERGADRGTARQMYARVYEQAKEEQVREWALRRLMMLRWLDERDAIRQVLAGAYAEGGRCPPWPAVTLALRRAGLRTNAAGVPIDPAGTPYLMVIGRQGCDVTLGPGSPVPLQ